MIVTISMLMEVGSTMCYHHASATNIVAGTIIVASPTKAVKVTAVHICAPPAIMIVLAMELLLLLWQVGLLLLMAIVATFNVVVVVVDIVMDNKVNVVAIGYRCF